MSCPDRDNLRPRPSQNLTHQADQPKNRITAASQSHHGDCSIQIIYNVTATDCPRKGSTLSEFSAMYMRASRQCNGWYHPPPEDSDVTKTSSFKLTVYRPLDEHDPARLSGTKYKNNQTRLGADGCQYSRMPIATIMAETITGLNIHVNKTQKKKLLKLLNLPNLPYPPVYIGSHVFSPDHSGSLLR